MKWISLLCLIGLLLILFMFRDKKGDISDMEEEAAKVTAEVLIDRIIE